MINVFLIVVVIIATICGLISFHEKHEILFSFFLTTIVGSFSIGFFVTLLIWQFGAYIFQPKHIEKVVEYRIDIIPAFGNKYLIQSTNGEYTYSYNSIDGGIGYAIQYTANTPVYYDEESHPYLIQYKYITHEWQNKWFYIPVQKLPFEFHVPKGSVEVRLSQ